MKKESYKIGKHTTTEYRFISEGKKKITKVVQFELINQPGIYNVGFGDLQDDGAVDDIVESNNNDMLKVMATIIHIIKDFLNGHPQVKLFFLGSTQQRTNFYRIILSRYYDEIEKEFSVTALTRQGEKIVELPFDPKIKDGFLAFFIRKNY